jgi:hypothetical protein
MTQFLYTIHTHLLILFIYTLIFFFHFLFFPSIPPSLSLTVHPPPPPPFSPFPLADVLMSLLTDVLLSLLTGVLLSLLTGVLRKRNKADVVNAVEVRFCHGGGSEVPEQKKIEILF